MPIVPISPEGMSALGLTAGSFREFTVNLRATITPRLTGPVRNELEAARRDVLSGIAKTETGRQILKQLVQPDAFSPAGKPSIVARMYRGPDGLYLGHAKGVNG